MLQDSRAYYRERYLTVIHDGEDAAEVVNSLAKSLMRNDSQAMDIVCRVIYYKFYDFIETMQESLPGHRIMQI